MTVRLNHERDQSQAVFIDMDRIYGEQLDPGIRDAFKELYPNGLPRDYRMSPQMNVRGVPYIYIEEYPRAEFYLNPPPLAESLFSTNLGHQSPRRVACVQPNRQVYLWSADEIQSVCNSVRQRFWALMRDMPCPSNLGELYLWFDAHDLYNYGTINLWNVIQHMYTENTFITRGYQDMVDVEINRWANEWLFYHANKSKLLAWDPKSGGRVIDLIDFQELQGLFQIDVHLGKALSSALLCRRDFMVRQYSSTRRPSSHMIGFFNQGNLENWLAGQRVFKNNGLPLCPLIPDYQLKNPKRQKRPYVLETSEVTGISRDPPQSRRRPARSQKFPTNVFAGRNTAINQRFPFAKPTRDLRREVLVNKSTKNMAPMNAPHGPSTQYREPKKGTSPEHSIYDADMTLSSTRASDGPSTPCPEPQKEASPESSIYDADMTLSSTRASDGPSTPCPEPQKEASPESSIYNADMTLSSTRASDGPSTPCLEPQKEASPEPLIDASCIKASTPINVPTLEHTTDYDFREPSRGGGAPNPMISGTVHKRASGDGLGAFREAKKNPAPKKTPETAPVPDISTLATRVSVPIGPMPKNSWTMVKGKISMPSGSLSKNKTRRARSWAKKPLAPVTGESSQHISNYPAQPGPNRIADSGVHTENVATAANRFALLVKSDSDSSKSSDKFNNELVTCEPISVVEPPQKNDRPQEASEEGEGLSLVSMASPNDTSTNVTIEEGKEAPADDKVVFVKDSLTDIATTVPDQPDWKQTEEIPILGDPSAQSDAVPDAEQSDKKKKKKKKKKSKPGRRKRDKKTQLEKDAGPITGDGEPEVDPVGGAQGDNSVGEVFHCPDIDTAPRPAEPLGNIASPRHFVNGRLKSRWNNIYGFRVPESDKPPRPSIFDIPYVSDRET